MLYLANKYDKFLSKKSYWINNGVVYVSTNASGTNFRSGHISFYFTIPDEVNLLKINTLNMQKEFTKHLMPD